MALNSWSGPWVRKLDVVVAKNYLTTDEVDTLNRLVVIFLEQAELRVKERKPLSLAHWREQVDRLLAFNDRPVLTHAGSVSHEAMKTIVHERFERFERFDEKRRKTEALAADAEDIQALESIAIQAKGKGRMNTK